MKNLGQYLRMVWKETPQYCIMLILESLLSSGRLLCNVIFPKYLIEELMGDMRADRLILWGGVIVGSNVLLNFCTNTLQKCLKVEQAMLYHRMNRVMAKKIMNLEYSYLENPYYLDLKEKAVFAVNNRNAAAQLIRNVSAVFTGVLQLTGLLVIMATLGPTLILALAAAIFFMLLLYRRMSDSLAEYTKTIIPINRRYQYYLDLAYDKGVQKDCRLYHLSEMITDRVVRYTKEVCDGFLLMGKKGGIALGGMNAINDITAAFCYLYVGMRTLGSGFLGFPLGTQISIGSLSMYVSAAMNFTSSVREMGESVVDAMQTLSFLEPYLEFMSLEEEEVCSGTEKLENGIDTIEFQNVTFTYPKAEKPVLKNISFSVKKGEKISVVGLNGAGKSTLVKLLCRMYKADSGDILINGKSIYRYDYEDYMNMVSAVFQDYRLFHFSISENISCEDENADLGKVNRLVEEVGMKEKIDSLPDGIRSRFGKEYDEKGIEMSGGEEQKIAIARALYKESSLVILDEPASALDPIAEAEIYEKFNSLVQDKTALYISHRMSSSVFCDRILVMEEGKVTDFDTHENLMQKTESLYYKLFHSQAQNYQIHT
ncbi:MAG: ABC transporter ATP-binding protein/permease [Bacillus sp. (in: Bacteria)]|nr:ABC transporter ATP-binding protein/permease [Bacillus sp. (in: firmicutes)]MCM1428093.1 ABC transporter ATP-binding protein/permease [Eubacterium sp.]